MAKRAIISSYRTIYPLLQISSRLVASTHFLKPAVVDPCLGRPNTQDIGGFLYESRRFFAKSRKKCNPFSISIIFYIEPCLKFETHII